MLLQIILRSFPFTAAEILPSVQTNYMTKSKNGYLMDKRTQNIIMEDLLGQVLKVNPTVALYCWFELLLPTLTAGSADQAQCEASVRYIELIHSLFQKPKFKSSSASHEYHSPQGLVLFLQLYRSNQRKKFQSRLKDVLSKTVQVLVFLKDNYPRRYFPALLPYAGQIQHEDEEQEDDSDPSLELKILAHCLLRDAQCIHVFETLYLTYVPNANNLMLYMAANWTKITTQDLPPKKLQQNAKALVVLLDKFSQLNTALLENKYRSKEGKQVGLKTLGLDRETVETALASCHSLEKAITRSGAARDATGSGGSSFRSYLLMFLVIVVTIYVLYVNKKIPQHWVDEVMQYVPNAVVDQVVKLQKQLGL